MRGDIGNKRVPLHITKNGEKIVIGEAEVNGKGEVVNVRIDDHLAAKSISSEFLTHLSMVVGTPETVEPGKTYNVEGK
jgi:hypothetical protein